MSNDQVTLSLRDGPLDYNRHVAIVTAPFDLTGVYIRRVHGVERLGEPFTLNVDLISSEPLTNFAQLAGKAMTVALEMQNQQLRYWNGIITRVAYVGLLDARVPHYLVELKPWLMLLDRRRNCRIFQDKTSNEIIRSIFNDHKQQNFHIRLDTDLPCRAYCVQYNETDLAFVSRLMEQDGLYYYFEHSKEKHELILVDNISKHPDASPQRVVTYPASPPQLFDVFWEWKEIIQLAPGQVTFSDYNYETPMAELTRTSLVQAVRTGGVPSVNPGILTLSDGATERVDQMTSASSIAASHELFSFPGRYTTEEEGDFYTKVRTEELACNTYRVQIEGCARQVKTGDVFAAANPFKETEKNPDQGPMEQWLAVGVEFEISGEIGDKAPADRGHRLYRSIVEAQVASTPYRSRQITPLPVAAGPETALVVGHPGETVTTDKYGRIKLRFFWDRNKSDNGSSSCWVRVAQKWAGKDFGDLVMPRVDHEVVVAFLHGNPDRPLVIGSVYNATNTPPDDPKLHPGRAIFKTRSTAGSRGYNELSFDDARGLEKVYLRAQKNYQVDVGSTHVLSVGERFSIVTPCALTPDGSRAESLGSHIDITPEMISFTLKTSTGTQSIQLGPQGIALIGTSISLLGTPGPITSVPFPVPINTPELDSAIASEAATAIIDATET